MLFTPHIQSILFSQHFSDHVLTVTKTILNWHKSRSIEQIKRPERNPHIWSINLWQGFPGGSSGKEACQRRRQEMQVWSQGCEDSQEDSMATHSTVHAWGTPWTEEPGRLQSIESQRVRHDWRLSVCACIEREWGMVVYLFWLFYICIQIKCLINCTTTYRRTSIF